MKKLLLVLIVFLPLSVFSQIRIGDTEYSTFSEAGDAATEDGDIITVSGVVTIPDDFVYGFKKDNLVIMGITPGATIKFGVNSRLGFEANKTIAVENLSLVAGTSSNETFLYVNDGTHLILKNDTIRDANHNTGHGGAFLLSGSSLTEVINCVFLNNKSLQNGGCFWMVNESDLMIKGSLFMDNIAQFEGVDGKGGVFATVDQNHDIFVENSAFINNRSEGHSGVFQAESNEGSVSKFVNCTFSGNYCGGQGGVSWFIGPGEDLTFINCTLIGNMSGGEGQGGIISFWNAGNTMTVINSVIDGNGYNDGVGNLFPGFSFTSNESHGLLINNSFIGENAVDITNISLTGSENLGEGDTYLEDINSEEQVNYYGISAGTSVLVSLGDPAFLSPYSETDQRGFIRNMDAEFITAGAFEYNAEALDSVVVKAIINEQVMTAPVFNIPLDGIFGIYLIPSGPLSFVEIEAESSDPDILKAEVDAVENVLVLTKLSEEETTITITLTGYSTKSAYNTISFDVLLSAGNKVSAGSILSNSIYPNPAGGFFMLSNTGSKELKGSIYNSSGNKVISIEIKNSRSMIDISSLENGLYILRAYDNNGMNYNYKFIKK